MTRKVWTGFGAVYLVLIAVDFVMKVLMWKFYPDLPLTLLRPRSEMKLLLCPVGFLFASFFLSFFFSKLRRTGGLREGLLFGLYMDLMVNPLFGLGLYAFLPLSFVLVFSWFLSRTVLLLIAGAVLARVFDRVPATARLAQPVAA